MSEKSVSAPPSGLYAERIVVWAPGGRTATLIAHVLEQAGLESIICEDIDVFCRLLDEGAGMALLMEEVFALAGHTERIETLLETQPPWSDLPVQVFVSDIERILPAYQRLRELNPRRGVTVLERPLSPTALVSVTKAALRHRRRQYELRDVLETLRATTEAQEERVREQTDQLKRLAGHLTRAEQTERRRISQLLHDGIQQLLFGIGMRLLMATRGDGPEIPKHLEKASEWVDQAVDMTRQLTTELSPPVLKSDSLTEVMKWLRHHVKALHDLEMHLETEGAHRVADEDLRNLLFQIVRELLFNVKKHAGVSEARVRLTREAGALAIHVIDKGSGFDLEEVAARERHIGGLGLSSIAERLSLMGGHLEIHSRPGEGSHFIVHTSSDEVEGATHDIESVSGLGMVPQQPLRLFAVHNHPVLHETLEMLFEHEDDMRIYGEAARGEQALHKITGTAPDVVLIDMSLPDMSGFELARALRSRHPDVSLILLSDYAEDHYVERALEVGAAGVVLKGDATAIPEAIRHVTHGDTYFSADLLAGP